MRLIWQAASPYGAPLLIVRGGATRDPEIKARLKDEGFRWNDRHHGWTTYEYERLELVERLAAGRDDIEIVERES